MKIAGLVSVIILLVYGYYNHKYINKISHNYNQILKTSLENTSTLQNIARNSMMRLVELDNLLNPSSQVPKDQRIRHINELIQKNSSYYEGFNQLPLTDLQEVDYKNLQDLRKICLTQTDTFINIINTGNLLAATQYFENVVQPSEQEYGTSQISFATSFRSEAYSSAEEVASMSTKISSLNILVSFIILLAISICIIYLIFLTFEFFKEIRWSGIAGDHVNIINK